MSGLTMSQPGMVQRRAQLEGCWRARLERLTALALAYHDVADPRPGQAGRSSAAKRRVRRLARRTVAERQELAEIEAALDRITTGSYGWCEQCRQPIGGSLLARRPQARYCTACDRQTGR